MKPAIEILEEKISSAMAAVTGLQDCSAVVKPATDSKFGDYQANGVMGLAKKMKTNPCKLAQQVIEKLDVSNICQQPEIAGPGFINLRLKPEFLSQALLKINADHKNLAVEKAANPQTVVVDFSGPNIAKQMHVGHLRSTIIGDCICRMLEFTGHKVIRQNHIGDWGTQFGMLTCYFKKIHQKEVDEQFNKGLTHFVTKDDWSISDMEAFYKEAKILFDTNPDFAQKSRDFVLKLHSGDKGVLSIWEYIVNESRSHYQPIYRALGVDLTEKNERGESFYCDKLADVVEELKSDGLAEESEGAICVFPEGFENKEGQPLPLIIQKTDGAFLYATTDLAAIRYRVDELKADKIVYVTDARQSLHFKMVFAVARKAGWANEKVDLQHVTFGSVMAEDGKPFKTRSGENVKLKDLLDEAVQRAKQVVEEKNPELGEKKKDRVAKAVGIGAVKYADYSNNRTSDYIFSFDRMLAMEGNTAPYMQYAYARIKSIERKAESRDLDIETELKGIETLSLTEPAELDLAKYLARYSEAIIAAASDYRPNYLTAYLYELAQKFSAFYSSCPVLKAEPDKRPTRLLLCDLTARTIRHGLSELLGIEVVEQM